MKISAVIQARCGSTRLPNKIFKKILEKYAIQHFIDRLKRSRKIDEIIIATTTKEPDNQIVEFCNDNNLKYYRGSEDNVLDRFYQASIKYSIEHIVRITSDCILIDPQIVDEMIDKYTNNNYNYLTVKYHGESTGAKGGFPDGCNPEIFSFKLLEKAWNNADNDFDKEHVTPYIKNNIDHINKYEIKISKTYNNINFSNLHLSLDTQEDLVLLSKIYETLYPLNNNFTIIDVLDFLESY